MMKQLFLSLVFPFLTRSGESTTLGHLKYSDEGLTHACMLFASEDNPVFAEW